MNNDRTIIDGNTYYAYDRWEIPAWYEEERGEYKRWREWRYTNISLEFQMQTWKLAEAMWKAKRPWLVALG